MNSLNGTKSPVITEIEIPIPGGPLIIALVGGVPHFGLNQVGSGAVGAKGVERLPRNTFNLITHLIYISEYLYRTALEMHRRVNLCALFRASFHLIQVPGVEKEGEEVGGGGRLCRFVVVQVNTPLSGDGNVFEPFVAVSIKRSRGKI